MESANNHTKIKHLINKGVKIPRPETVTIGENVSVNRISGNAVTIHSGSKIFGSKTLIMEGCEIGYEGPVTIDNCQLGPYVNVKGGHMSQSTFLKNVIIQSCADIRAGSLLEEGVRCGHSVGLKQTILLPFVTLGNLINFCDCLMAGGSGEKNHSEVGSSYIHFNYTPDQDKATPSLIGDVPHGVMLNQKPIFLGGQGGLVGPSRIGCGTVIAAGTIYRKDFLKGNGLVFAGQDLKEKQPFQPTLYSGIKRIIVNNINYIANVIALHRWYKDVRLIFVGPDDMEKAIFEGAIEKIEMVIHERMKRLEEVSKKMPESIKLYKSLKGENALEKPQVLRREFSDHWPAIKKFLKDSLNNKGDPEKRSKFLGLIKTKKDKGGMNYIQVIKGLKTNEDKAGTEWLQGLVNEINDGGLSLISSLRA